MASIDPHRTSAEMGSLPPLSGFPADALPRYAVLDTQIFLAKDRLIGLSRDHTLGIRMASRRGRKIRNVSTKMPI